MNPKELLETKHIQYLPRGADLVVRCWNPKHEDRNPSMRIDSISGVFNCLSCGFRGNVFEHFGVKTNFLDRKRLGLKSKIQLKLAENVGLTIPENAVIFNRNWRGIRGETFEQFEAFEHSDKQHIGRVVFPIRAISNKIVGFVGRHLTANHNPKYLISPTGAKLPLYPANPSLIHGRIILVEGILDMINLHDKGLTNAVCAFGTRKLTKGKQETADKLNLLKVRGVTGIDILFDGDEAGQKAAAEIKGLCESLEFDVRSDFIEDRDPGELTASEVIELKEMWYGENSFSRDETESYEF